VRCLVLLWRFCRKFGVVLEILWDVWCCSGDSVCCLVLLWSFCRMFGVALKIL
jgi:hypothetical protein